MSKIDKCQLFLGILFFKGDNNILSIISLYNVVRIISRLKNLNYILEINILRNHCQKNLDVLRGDFRGTGCPKDA